MRKNLIKKLIATVSLSLAIASVGSNVFVYAKHGCQDWDKYDGDGEYYMHKSEWDYGGAGAWFGGWSWVKGWTRCHIESDGRIVRSYTVAQLESTVLRRLLADSGKCYGYPTSYATASCDNTATYRRTYWGR